jgi:hypothetical protein
MTVLIPVICCATANPTPTIIAGRKRGLSSSDQLRDDQLHVADTGLVNAGIIDLVEDSLAESEPDATLVAEGFANAGFRAGSPAWLNVGRPRRLAIGVLA